MQEPIYEYLRITDLKDMLNKTKQIYENDTSRTDTVSPWK